MNSITYSKSSWDRYSRKENWLPPIVELTPWGTGPAPVSRYSSRNVTTTTTWDLWKNIYFAGVLDNTKQDLIFYHKDELEEDTKIILGENGVNRFEKFKTYQRGWDFGRGTSLNFSSISVMEAFLSLCKKAPEEPSLFLTNEGNLQLGFEDKNGNVVEIEFFPSKIEFYIESLDKEGQVKLRIKEVEELISLISEII